MKSHILLLFLVTLLGVGFITYKVSYSFFSDTGNSNSNILAASETFPTATPTNTPTPTATPPVTPTFTPTPTIPIANHLVINEVLYDTSSSQNIDGQGGSNRGEFVEIYNPTADSVNLSGWTVEDNTSSESLSGTLSPGNFLILTGATESEFESIWTVPSGVIYVQAGGGTIGNGLANGGDTVILKNSGSEIDKMSWGTDITGFSSGCTSSCPITPTGQSFERDPDGKDTDAAGDFIIRNPPIPGS
ncbi:lamin tail domain-containing protein [Candidatus Roizmanbacteria bacterium]|nr:lamin tail domain-containing protein [Candidatus Roizmanbacteria bacterium]